MSPSHLPNPINRWTHNSYTINHCITMWHLWKKKSKAKYKWFPYALTFCSHLHISPDSLLSILFNVSFHIFSQHFPFFSLSIIHNIIPSSSLSWWIPYLLIHRSALGPFYTGRQNTVIANSTTAWKKAHLLQCLKCHCHRSPKDLLRTNK